MFCPVLVEREENEENAYQLTGDIYFDESTESPTKNWQRELGKTAWVRVLFTDTKKEEFVPRGNIITTHSTDLSDVQLEADNRH